MATENEFYSFKGAEPQLLPNEIVLSNGFTRTNPKTFTSEELESAGYTGPYTRPSYDSTTHFIVWNRTLREWEVNEFPKDPGPSPAELIERLRQDRNRLLQVSDWTVMPDSPLTEEEKQPWKTYRQALRDLPSEFETVLSPNNRVIRNLDSEEEFQNITWPVSPSV